MKAPPIVFDEQELLAGLSSHEIAQLRASFDPAFYLSENADVRDADVDPFAHYMALGCREGRDPSPEFSTNFYLEMHGDVAASGMNPFVHWVLHGRRELRTALPFAKTVERRHYAPRIAAMLINFENTEHLPQRLDSILEQTYPNIEIIILDNGATEASRAIIYDYSKRFPDRIRTIFDGEYSDSPFDQWRKAIEHSAGELIWICTSDDFCEPNFIARLVPSFADDSVQIAFGRIIETNLVGEPDFSLDRCREDAEPGIWAAPLVRPAGDWFAHAFGVGNMIATVGGCIFRRSPLPDAVWQEAARYPFAGDWYLYIQIASGGQIAWQPKAISYLRRREENASSRPFASPHVYRELEWLMRTLRETWDIPQETVRTFHRNVANHYDRFEVARMHGPLDAHFSLNRLLNADRARPHVLIAMIGFIPGGGENFPIQLANGLVDAGWMVSMLIFTTETVNIDMRAALKPAVSVYEASWVLEYGCERFLREAGVSLIHSHAITAEMYFYDLWNLDPARPYLVTLHGSYEASDLSLPLWKTITQSIDYFVYTADKNLLPLASQNLASSKFVKMANAMPIDPISFPHTRKDMGIAEDAIIFTMVARGIKCKGWRAAIEAFHIVRACHPDRAMHLCLVGEGKEPDRQRARYGGDPDISFLGYQLRIHGLYRMTDVAIVPTRFVGESYPLCIIQAMQVGTPVIATDMGEICGMLQNDAGIRGGLVVEAVRDTERFIATFADAMEAMLDDGVRRTLSDGAQVLGQGYDMELLVERYAGLYAQIIERSRTAASIQSVAECLVAT